MEHTPQIIQCHRFYSLYLCPKPSLEPCKCNTSFRKTKIMYNLKLAIGFKSWRSSFTLRLGLGLGLGLRLQLGLGLIFCIQVTTKNSAFVERHNWLKRKSDNQKGQWPTWDCVFVFVYENANRFQTSAEGFVISRQRIL